METDLREIFADVSDWLKFAESKNAALLAGDLAGLYAVARLLFDGGKTDPWIKLGAWIVAIFLGLAALVALLSFLPQLQLPGRQPSKITSADDNLLLFSDIANYEPDQYLEALAGWRAHSGESFDSFERGYAEQIVANSRIATTKFAHFTAAMWLSVAAFVSPVVVVLVFLLANGG